MFQQPVRAIPRVRSTAPTPQAKLPLPEGRTFCQLWNEAVDRAKADMGDNWWRRPSERTFITMPKRPWATSGKSDDRDWMVPAAHWWAEGKIPGPKHRSWE